MYNKSDISHIPDKKDVILTLEQLRSESSGLSDL